MMCKSGKFHYHEDGNHTRHLVLRYHGICFGGIIAPYPIRVWDIVYS